MKFVRYASGLWGKYGLVEGEQVREIQGDTFGPFDLTDRVYPLASLKILPPCTPSKMVIVGLNYAGHAKETGQPKPEAPQFFPLAANAIIAHREPIILPPGIGRVDFEAELVAIIGRVTKGVSPEQALSYVAGYTCGNDVSARDLQWGQSNLPRGKTVDTFAPLGPFVETELDPGDVQVESRVNGLLRQSSHSSEMIFPVPVLVSAISQYVTLYPGDVIFTGTPKGIGPLGPGDVVEVTVDKIGTLWNPVVEG